jgi:PLP dependent protein
MTNDKIAEIGLNIAGLRQRIAKACERCRRSPAEITLIAVSKTQTVETVEDAYRAGLRVFGENRIEEAIPKLNALKQRLPAGEEIPAWHLIGHLQSRKAPLINGHFCCLHSVDSFHLAQKLDRHLNPATQPPLPVLLECNVSGEESKYGFNLRDW